VTLALRVVLLLAVFATAARAEDEATFRAKAHFEAGRALFTLGNYPDAVREFVAGYQLSPRPQFLINIGQTYRLMGELDKAHDAFQKYVATSAADDAYRKQVIETVLPELEREIAQKQSAQEAVRAPPPTSGVTAPAAASVARTDSATPSDATRPSRLRKLWWTIPLGVVVAGGLAVGIYFGVREGTANRCNAYELGCLDASR
jgi:tetratricopeptide (TPR) repeat protein